MAIHESIGGNPQFEVLANMANKVGSVVLGSSASSTSNDTSGIGAVSIPMKPSSDTPPSRTRTLVSTTASTFLGITVGAFGWTTAIALGLLLWRSWLLTKKGETGDKVQNSNNSLWWIASRAFLQMIGLQKSSDKEHFQRDGQSTGHADGSVLLHRGSCQCGAISFALNSPRDVPVLKNYKHIGKLQYQATARVPADQLQLKSGKPFWSTYHVSSNDNTIWAFSFCRKCATQLLHATEEDQSSLFVNVDCFDAFQQKMQSKQTKSMDADVSTPNSTAASTWDESSVSTALPYFADPRLLNPSQTAPSMPASSTVSLRNYSLDLCAFAEGAPRNYRADAKHEDLHIGQNIVMDNTNSRFVNGDVDSISSRSSGMASKQCSRATSVTVSTSSFESNRTASSSSIDYNVSSSREAMLYNMRKHLSDVPNGPGDVKQT